MLTHSHIINYKTAVGHIFSELQYVDTLTPNVLKCIAQQH